MRHETTISRKAKENNVTIILELKGKYEKELKNIIGVYGVLRNKKKGR